jgi:hypothetical protein
VKRRHVIINAGNFKNDMALQNSVFPFGCSGCLNPGIVFSHSDIKGEQARIINNYKFF